MMAVSTSLTRTGATATPPTVSEARVILPPSICNSAAADTMAKSPWRRANSMKADLWPAGQSGTRIAVTISLVLGGAIGNAIDRLHWPGVMDFVLFHIETAGFEFRWYVFNLADVAIVAGVLVLLYESLLGGAAKAP